MIIIRAFYKKAIFGIKHQNWGDDMNYYLLKEFGTNKWVLNIWNIPVISKILNIKRHHLFIGSVLNSMMNEASIISGAGFIAPPSNNDRIVAPKSINFVRGPLTRQIFISRGIKCPELYGDPILALPSFYVPNLTDKKVDIVYIPHYVDESIPLQTIFGETEDTVNVVSLHSYKHWKDVVDKVVHARLVVTSSLHGTILCEAYKIPYLTIKVSDNLIGGDFKFQDFWMSIGVTREVYDIKTISLQQLIQQSKPVFGMYDIEKLTLLLKDSWRR